MFEILQKHLDKWAEMSTESSVAMLLRKRFETDVTKNYKVSGALLADAACFMSAVYTGGYEAGYKSSIDETDKFDHLWFVWETTDERGTKGAFIGAFSTEAAAKEHAKGRGWYGGDARTVKQFVHHVNGNYIVAQQTIAVDDVNIDIPASLKQKREKALAKLTPEERRLLGLD